MWYDKICSTMLACPLAMDERNDWSVGVQFDDLDISALNRFLQWCLEPKGVLRGIETEIIEEFKIPAPSSPSRPFLSVGQGEIEMVF